MTKLPATGEPPAEDYCALAQRLGVSADLLSELVPALAPLVADRPGAIEQAIESVLKAITLSGFWLARRAMPPRTARQLVREQTAAARLRAQARRHAARNGG